MATEADGRGGPAPNVSPPTSSSSIDLATIVGIPGAFLLIFMAIYLGGSPGAFINLPSVFIVLGGTFGVTTACFSLSDMSAAIRIVAQTVFHRSRDPAAAAIHAINTHFCLLLNALIGRKPKL